MNAKTIHVNMAEIQVTLSPNRLVCIGLGSCIGLVLYEPKHKIGGMAHIMLPRAYGVDNVIHPGKFANTAVAELIKQMVSKQASQDNIQAQVFGGASMFPSPNTEEQRSIGAYNTRAVLHELNQFNIPVLAQEVGGQTGRTIIFETASGQVFMKLVRPCTEKIFCFKSQGIT